MPKQLIREASPTPLATSAPSKSGRLEVTLITPGWGSSGYYSAAVLKNAAEAGIWQPGHQMFADHPGENEAYDRPERSIRDLAATLTETARWDEEGQRVVGEAQVFPHMVELLTDEHFAKSIGVSIRAYAESRHGEAEGRKGQIVTRLDEAISTDFVTVAGRGGAIAAVMESARPSQVVERAVSHGVAEATANDTRDGLQAAVIAAYGGEKTWVWVRDFDEAQVWFTVETPDTNAIYQQAYVIDGDTFDLDGEATEVRARTEYVPVNPTSAATESDAPDQPTNVPAPAGQPHPTPISKETNMGTKQVDEAEFGRLTEAAGRVPTLESERDTAAKEAATAKAELAKFKAREAARPAVTKKVGESSLPATRKARIVESILKQVRLDENGKANLDELVELTEAEVRDSETEIAEIAESLGVGSVRGFGPTVTESTGYSVEDFDAAFNPTKEA